MSPASRAELLTGVTAAMDHYQLERCPAADIDWNGDVTVADLMCGIRSALDGCD